MKYSLFGTTINYLIKNSILQTPDYIKIDVDGIEHLILEGGSQYLEDKKIKSLLIEVNEVILPNIDILKKCIAAMLQANV